MTEIHHNHCSLCKTEEQPLLIHGRKTLKNGDISIRKMCRPCNTKRHKEYRATPDGKRKTYRAIYKSIDKLRYKQNAREELNHALRTGEVTKQPCIECGEENSEGHHEDYDKPLEVVWLCRTHHADVHRTI